MVQGSQGAWQMINAVRRKDDEQDFIPELEFIGYKTALMVMGIFSDDRLCAELSDILYTAMDRNPREDYSVLAKKVYASWMSYLKQYSLSNLKPVA